MSDLIVGLGVAGMVGALLLVAVDELWPVWTGGALFIAVMLGVGIRYGW